jgi:hypothetical protein
MMEPVQLQTQSELLQGLHHQEQDRAIVQAGVQDRKTLLLFPTSPAPIDDLIQLMQRSELGLASTQFVSIRYLKTQKTLRKALHHTDLS